MELDDVVVFIGKMNIGDIGTHNGRAVSFWTFRRRERDGHVVGRRESVRKATCGLGRAGEKETQKIRNDDNET